MNENNEMIDSGAIDFHYTNDLNAVYNYLCDMFDGEGISYNDRSLLLLVDQSWRIIARYKGLDPVMADYYPYFSAIAELTIAYFNNSLYNMRILKGEEIVSSVSEGGNSISFASHVIEIGDDGLTANVRAILKEKHHFCIVD